MNTHRTDLRPSGRSMQLVLATTLAFIPLTTGCDSPLSQDSAPETALDARGAAPSLSSTTAPAEPAAGTTLLTRHTFGTLTEDKWVVRLLGAANYAVKPYGSIAMGSWRLPAPPSGGAGVGVMRFPEGMPSGNGPASTIRLLPSKPKVLDLRFDLAQSPNWYGNTSGISKIMFVFIAGKPMAYPTSYGQADKNLYFRLVTQNLGAGHDGTTSGSSSYGGYAAGPAALLTRGKWRQVRLLLVANTPGRRDGEAHGWIDGVQIFSNKAVGWCGSSVSAAACGFDAIRYNPTYGGSGGPVPETQYMYLAGLEAYGR